jgi:hypothetical protein
MASATSYKGRHTRPQAFAGSTPRGPERWARAAHNALTNPRTAGAKLFMDRVATARKLADEYESVSRPVAFMDGNGEKLRRKYVTCGIHCTVMQAQLDWQTTSLLDIERLLMEGRLVQNRLCGNGRTYQLHQTDWLEPLDLNDLTRSVRCTVCGTSVRPPRKR